MFSMKRNYLLAASAIVASLVLAACPPPQAAAPAAPAAQEAAPAADAAPADAERSSTVVFDIDGGKVADPTLWNQYVPTARRDHGYHQAIYEPLFILNYQDGQMIPWLGESFTPNATQDVWTLKLRSGIEWSDGTPMTSDDVVFTIQMLLDNVANGLNDAASMDTWIESVTKIDDVTTEFKLKKPNPRFQLDYFSVRIWGGVSIMPKHIWEGQDPVTFKNYDAEKGWPVGTGAYTLKSFNSDGTEFVFARNDNWWGKKSGWRELPAPQTLKFMWAGAPETRAALMQKDEIDSLMDITLGALQALQATNPNIVTWYTDLPKAWVPDPCSRTFEFNTTREPWNDPEMRWAINYAIDRDQIVTVAYEGSTFKSRHFYPAYPPLDAYIDAAEEAGTWNTEQLWTHDAAKAAEIIEAKGYTKNGEYYEKDGKQLALDITTHEAFIEKQRIADVIVEQLQAIGINASRRNEAGSQWDENYRNGNFEARMGWYTCGSVNEPWASLDTFNVSWVKPEGERADFNGWRWQGAQAEAYSKIVDEMGTLPLGDPKLQELFNEAMKIWFAELPAIPITQAKKVIPFNSKYWTNWPTADNDYFHPPTWWQGTHYIIHEIKPAGQ